MVMVSNVVATTDLGRTDGGDHNQYEAVRWLAQGHNWDSLSWGSNKQLYDYKKKYHPNPDKIIPSQYKLLD